MTLDSFDDIRAAGFSGFKSVRDLKVSNCESVPDVAGVYIVTRRYPHGSHQRAAAVVSKGGILSSRFPEFKANWVPGTAVVYIGRAGGGNSGNTLRKRLRTYMRFGAGEPVGHWGGRYIWQLEDCDSLTVCWQCAGFADAAARESDLIREFSATYGRRPFANLSG